MTCPDIRKGDICPSFLEVVPMLLWSTADAFAARSEKKDISIQNHEAELAQNSYVHLLRSSSI